MNKLTFGNILIFSQLLLTYSFSPSIKQSHQFQHQNSPNELQNFFTLGRQRIISLSAGRINEYYIQKVNTTLDVWEGAALSIKVFFGTSNNFLKNYMLRMITMMQYKDLLLRYSSNNNAMYKASDQSGKVIGFSEIFLWENDFKRTRIFVDEADVELEESRLYPKLANLAVDERYRRSGLGTCLLYTSPSPRD